MYCILLPGGTGALGRFLARELSAPFFSHGEIAAQLAEMTGNAPALLRADAEQMLVQEAGTWLRMGEPCVLECAGAAGGCPGLAELLRELDCPVFAVQQGEVPPAFGPAAVTVPAAALSVQDCAAALQQLQELLAQGTK